MKIIESNIPKSMTKGWIEMEESSYLFLAGAPKCGTTSIAEWLSRMEDVCVSSVKEPLYFTDFSDRVWSGPGVGHFRQPWAFDEKQYDKTYKIRSAKWRVDASTDYLQNLAAFERIGDLSKRCQVKIVVVVRDPVDRAVSQYKHTQREGYSNETLLQALKKENDRIKKGMHPLFWHVSRSRYFNSVKRYHEEFGENLLVLDYHDIENEIGKIPKFLGLPSYSRDLGIKNSSKEGYHPLISKMLRQENIRMATRFASSVGIKKKVKEILKSPLESFYTIDDDGMELLRFSLKEEIEKCFKYKEIPTEFWKK